QAVRSTCALLAGALGASDEGFAREACAILLEAMPQAKEPITVRWQSESLRSLAGTLSGPEKAQICTKGARSILDLMAKATRAEQLVVLSAALDTLAESLTPEEAASVSARAVKLSLMLRGPLVNQGGVGFILGNLVERLSADEAAKTAEEVLTRL